MNMSRCGPKFPLPQYVQRLDLFILDYIDVDVIALELLGKFLIVFLKSLYHKTIVLQVFITNFLFTFIFHNRKGLRLSDMCSHVHMNMCEHFSKSSLIPGFTSLLRRIPPGPRKALHTI